MYIYKYIYIYIHIYIYETESMGLLSMFFLVMCFFSKNKKNLRIYPMCARKKGPCHSAPRPLFRTQLS